MKELYNPNDWVHVHRDYLRALEDFHEKYCVTPKFDAGMFELNVYDPFYDLKLAHLRGKEVEYRLGDGRWIPAPYPSFIGNIEDWRVKDE